MSDTRRWRGRAFVGVSLDGFIARADGDLSWLTELPGGREHVRIDSSRQAQSWERFFPSIDHVVMGRTTYDTVIGFDEWPHMYEDKAVIVLSTTLPSDTEHVTVARTVHEVAEILNKGGAREVYVDGGKTIQGFLRAGLIDELTTCWAPILIGNGRRLFDLLDHDLILTLRGNHATETGMVHTTYEVASDRAFQTTVG